MVAPVSIALLSTLMAFAAAQDRVDGFGGSGDVGLGADNCELTEGGGRTTCSGNVIVTQGIALLAADRMTVTGLNTPEGFSTVEAQGGVRYQEGVNAASGDQAFYDRRSGDLRMMGNVVLVQGEQVLTGGELFYNTITGAMQIKADQNGGRVQGLFQTDQDVPQ